MVGSNILTRKQLEKMSNDFAMKLQNNIISKQTELINGNKEQWKPNSTIEKKKMNSHRLGETGGIIVKLINKKDAQNVLEEKRKP